MGTSNNYWFDYMESTGELKRMEEEQAAQDHWYHFNDYHEGCDCSNCEQINICRNYDRSCEAWDISTGIGRKCDIEDWNDIVNMNDEEWEAWKQKAITEKCNSAEVQECKDAIEDDWDLL